MFVVFEGIDGSGKTVLSTRVARALRAAGLRVEHVREGGTFCSPIVQRIRELGRDARNLMLAPHAELLFYAAREAQLQAEVTQPALSRADVVIADRYFYSAEVLAIHGRGMDPTTVRAMVNAASGAPWLGDARFATLDVANGPSTACIPRRNFEKPCVSSSSHIAELSQGGGSPTYLSSRMLRPRLSLTSAGSGAAPGARRETGALNWTS